MAGTRPLATIILAKFQIPNFRSFWGHIKSTPLTDQGEISHGVNFVKSKSIFTILLPLEREVNLQ